MFVSRIIYQVRISKLRSRKKVNIIITFNFVFSLYKSISNITNSPPFYRWKIFPTVPSLSCSGHADPKDIVFFPYTYIL